ncbi:hypothetical protein TNIN_344921 [Trichonephila inaurata madagascariensis]|uniref:Uncharacterized protein n=1 Tax=Trichonephila inaurata madagascariensis TaxID=2747483 RepID=A0A8X6Y2L9_9ARAC|nr:hypothetical protein TNIN_344921 [Trichonephila inaurata madagascariensis]
MISGLESMEDRTTGQNFLECSVNSGGKSDLSWNQMARITTDEATAFRDFILTIRWEERRYEMIFADDMFEKLNELNERLKGKMLFTDEMWKYVKSF